MQLIAFSLILSVLLLAPPVALGRSPQAPKLFKPGDFCGVGKELRKLRIAQEFYHVTQLDVVLREHLYFITRFGKCLSYDPQSFGYRLQMEKGTVDVGVRKTDEGELLLVEILAAQRNTDSVELAMLDFAELSPKAALYVSKNGKTIFEKNADRAFDSYRSRYIVLLGVLMDKVAKKAFQLSAVVPIDEAKKSRKTDFLNQFPAGALFTVDTLKNFLLFYDDEAAADHLLALLDRKDLNGLEKKRGYFLSNREKGELLTKGSPGLIVKNHEGSELTLTKADVEWHFSPRSLCESLYKLHGDPALIRKNSIVDENHRNFSTFFNWENGAYQVTKLLKNHGGDWICISASGDKLTDQPVAYGQMHLTLTRVEKASAGK